MNKVDTVSFTIQDQNRNLFLWLKHKVNPNTIINDM